jgi:hypothetical protein
VQALASSGDSDDLASNATTTQRTEVFKLLVATPFESSAEDCRNALIGLARTLCLEDVAIATLCKIAKLPNFAVTLDDRLADWLRRGDGDFETLQAILAQLSSKRRKDTAKSEPGSSLSTPDSGTSTWGSSSWQSWQGWQGWQGWSESRGSR